MATCYGFPGASSVPKRRSQPKESSALSGCFIYSQLRIVLATTRAGLLLARFACGIASDTVSDRFDTLSRVLSREMRWSTQALSWPRIARPDT